MLFRSLILAGVAVSNVSALLVVPDTSGDIAPEPIGSVDAAAALALLDSEQQQATLQCTECPFPDVDESGQVHWTDGFETSIVCFFFFFFCYPG